MRIGLYFGTFNPIHIGHLIIANHMAEFSDLDEIWLIVTPHNPHKQKSTLLDDHHRLYMVQLAVDDYPKLKASEVEFKLAQPNYTVHTLSHLTDKYPQHQFSLIMGEDNLYSLHKWKNYEQILANHAIYIYPRIFNKHTETIKIESENIFKIDAPIIELSSTAIRAGIKANKNMRPMMPEKVWQYVEHNLFYKK
jgi:nicotinate-nucleotide adenylyltransferase